MLDKYITYEESNEAGQDAKTGFWYVKKLLFNDAVDLDKKITEANKVLNKHNKNEEKK